MEPGHEDREYADCDLDTEAVKVPQWSPVMKTGNTGASVVEPAGEGPASMEPGHEDREYDTLRSSMLDRFRTPQWSPVMKTGNTPSAGSHTHDRPPSMEPGHEDREYEVGGKHIVHYHLPQWSPVMKTGNTRSSRAGATRSLSLNGARS